MDEVMEIEADIRRRIIWDSIAITDATIGTSSFFTSIGTKTFLQQSPKIANILPDGQRMRVDGMAIAFPSTYNQDDSSVLDGIVFTLRVENNEVESDKIKGLTRQFPAGGGVAGALAIGDDGVTVQRFNNGTPSAASWFQIDPAIVIDPKINFRVDMTVPAVLTGLTAGRIYCMLQGVYEFFLPRR